MQLANKLTNPSTNKSKDAPKSKIYIHPKKGSTQLIPGKDKSPNNTRLGKKMTRQKSRQTE